MASLRSPSGRSARASEDSTAGWSGGPRLLDLFCGAGGAAKGYQRAGFYVVGVDNRPQPRYAGDEFHLADALTFPLDGYDAIHASPPCQAYSSMTRVRGRAGDHPMLIGPTRERLAPTGLPYIIENVERARVHLITPVLICAVALGLRVDGYVLRRHRLFETNWPLLTPGCGCHRGDGKTIGVYGGGTRQHTRRAVPPAAGTPDKANRAQARALMELPDATREECNQAIPAAYTEMIGYQLLSIIERSGSASGSGPQPRVRHTTPEGC